MTVTFPDTMYLPDRARLALNCLTGLLNREKGYLPYCLVDLTGNPPRMQHTQFDYSDHTARVIDAILLAQAMSGDDRGTEEVERLENLFWGGFREDGLHYTPANPWSFEHANTHYQRSVLNALMSLIKVRGSERAADQARRLARGLSDISIKRDGFAYFPAVEYLPDGWPRGDWEILSFGTDPANTNGRLIFGLASLYDHLGDEVARDLAGLYASHVMDHSSAFLPDGSFATGMEFREGHFHSRALTLLGVIRYGHSAGDARAVAWGHKVFTRAKQYGTAFGWYPERIVRERAHGCETCATVDMLEAAIWLAKSGYPELWEDAERILRNQLLESQLLDAGWLEACGDERAEDEWSTTVDVARRSVGGWSGWSQPNDFVSKVMHSWDLYTCCCAQGVRGLFNAWGHAVCDDGNDASRVNLLINHDSDLATVKSWLPNEGRLEITPKRSGGLSLRIPSWVDRRSIRATVGGEVVAGRFVEKHFLRFDAVAAGKTLQIEFPIVTSRTRETVLGVDYAVEWRGDTVVDVNPGGTVSPLYRREAMKRPVTASISRDPHPISFIF